MTTMMIEVNNDNALENPSVRNMVAFIEDASRAVKCGDYADAVCALRCAARLEKKVFFSEEGDEE